LERLIKGIGHFLLKGIGLKKRDLAKKEGFGEEGVILLKLEN